MTEQRPSGDRRRSVVQSLSQEGFADIPIRRMVDQVAQAPDIDGELLTSILGKLHDQGVVNLDSSLKQILDAVGLEDLERMKTDILANDNICLVVRPSPEPGKP